MGRWLERAKAAHAKRQAEVGAIPPPPHPNGEKNCRRASTTSATEECGVGTSGRADPAKSHKESTDGPKAGAGVNTLEGAQKAQKAQKVDDLPPASPDVDYIFVDSADGLEAVVEELKRSEVVGLDLETTGVCWWQDRIRIVSITAEAGDTYVIDVFKVNIEPLYPTLKGIKIVAHNAAFDVLFLKRAGGEPGEYACTMILSQILWAGKLKPGTDKNVDHDLAAVAWRTLGIKLDKSHQNDDWSGKLTPEMLDYAAKDSAFLLQLYEELIRRIEEAGEMDWVIDIEMRLLKAMVHISDNGLPVDPEKWAEYVEAVEHEIRDLYAMMDFYVEGTLPNEYLERNEKNKDGVPHDRVDKVNWRSANQVGWAFEQHGITLPKTARGNVSMSKDVMKGIDHPLARHVERLNKIKNVPTTFGKALKERYADGRIHAGWKQCEADTGRMSCANPPFQGIPSKGELRKAVVAPEGYKLVVSDLSQIEIRVLAALSGDQALIGAFKDPKTDIHRNVAATVLGKELEDVTDEERKIAKSIVFGQMYGQGVSSLRTAIQNRLGRGFSESEAVEYWSKFFDAYPGVKRWRAEEEAIFDAGYRYTRTLKGRRRLDVDTKPKRWNSPIQGLAADVLKAIAVTVYERREEILGLEMVGLVHDEVILLVPEEHAERAADWLTEIMESVGDAVVNGDRAEKARVSIKADTSVCPSWGDKQ